MINGALVGWLQGGLTVNWVATDVCVAQFQNLCCWMHGHGQPHRRSTSRVRYDLLEG